MCMLRKVGELRWRAMTVLQDSAGTSCLLTVTGVHAYI